MSNAKKSLSLIADSLRKKGFEKQAVLLSGRTGDTYTRVLIDPIWRPQVEAKFGKEILDQLVVYTKKNIMQPIEKLIGPVSPLSGFSPSPIASPPLEITLESHVTKDDLIKANQICSRVNKNLSIAFKMVMEEARMLIGGNEELLFEIYKDDDEYSQDLNGDQIEKKRKDYVERIHLYKTSGEILKNLRSGVPITDRLPLLKIPPNASLQAKSKLIAGHLKEIKSDPVLIKESFQKYIDYQKSNLRSRVIELGQAQLTFWQFLAASATTEIDASHLGKSSIYGVLADETRLDPATLESPDTDLYELFMTSSIECRQRVLDYFDKDIDMIKDNVVGLEQIVQGGHITNPNITRISALQNHSHLPNLDYSAKTRVKVGSLARLIKQDLDQLPDVSDIGAPSRIKKATRLVYTIREMDKNPLDVAFGNDSGCCIFVPGKVEELRNGEYVSYYLQNPKVRLFEVPVQIEKRKQRIGFMLAFDANDEAGENILVVNSLELSRMGIRGGRKTLLSVVSHVEEYLEQYAKTSNYRGVVMGTHSYNTSYNYSSRNLTPVTERFYIDLKIKLESSIVVTLSPFYSDVLEYEPDKFRMVTRENSVHWVWQK